ncbi:MAG: alpha/beta hydrolase [Polyangiales bacterium]
MVETHRIGGREVAFRHEPGRAPTLICVHGSAENHHVYDRLLEALGRSGGRNRYAINLPGRAGSDGPLLRSVAEMQEFLARFIKSEVTGDYLIVGHSLGGGVAIEHAVATRSERLKGIVLLGSGARLRVLPLILQIFEQASKSGERPPLPAGAFEPGADPALVADAIVAREGTSIETGAADWRAADRFDRMQDLARIRVPALIVAGRNDTLTPPKYAEYLAAKIPHAELHIIEGAGHMFLMERPADVARWIEEFVGEHASG